MQANCLFAEDRKTHIMAEKWKTFREIDSTVDELRFSLKCQTVFEKRWLNFKWGSARLCDDILKIWRTDQTFCIAIQLSRSSRRIIQVLPFYRSTVFQILLGHLKYTKHPFLCSSCEIPAKSIFSNNLWSLAHEQNFLIWLQYWNGGEEIQRSSQFRSTRPLADDSGCPSLSVDPKVVNNSRMTLQRIYIYIYIYIRKYWPPLANLYFGDPVYNVLSNLTLLN